MRRYNYLLIPNIIVEPPVIESFWLLLFLVIFTIFLAIVFFFVILISFIPTGGSSWTAFILPAIIIIYVMKRYSPNEYYRIKSIILTKLKLKKNITPQQMGELLQQVQVYSNNQQYQLATNLLVDTVNTTTWLDNRKKAIMLRNAANFAHTSGTYKLAETLNSRAYKYDPSIYVQY